MNKKSNVIGIEELQQAVDIAEGWKQLSEKWKSLFELSQKENEFLKQTLLDIRSECYKHIADGT